MYQSVQSQPDTASVGGVWENLNIHHRQRAIELLALLAVKRLTEKMTLTTAPVADDPSKEPLCCTIKSVHPTK